MAKPASTSKKRKQDEMFKAVRNIGGVIAILGLVGFFYFKTVMSHPPLDPETQCPARPKSVTVLLVDVTDPMNLPQRQDFLNQLDRLVDDIPRYGKLVVVKVDPVSDRLLVPVIVRCNPGSAKDETEMNGNPARLEKLHDERFVAPLKAAYDQLLTASGADQSPILESIQSVALTELNKPSIGDIPKRLVVASDLLQNTSSVSFYKALPDPVPFTNGQDFSRVRTDLRDTDVELWMLQRSDSNQTQPRALPELWEKIIDKEGGKLKRVYTVSG
ncbi:hypothetical protein ABAC460_01225 [Asticcacaulis sp. AC460]|uniref:hypothetical protein n=1 Tax=Asticcacaulis sp. AC460 TaxID=1282360 RepID=UPI0003C3CBE6|nr:hypothetical protein [Asticcacaulis sp. AC460]ESQ92896.1 hypothetical protein ABAC460_01225 [Asticcacaulis sp. AC460]